MISRAAEKGGSMNPVGMLTLVAALVVALPVYTSAPRVVTGRMMPADTIPVVLENDNRVPAGTLRDGELNIDLVVQMARWFPEAADGPSIVVPVVAEEGGPPRVPAPLIRVPEGTIIVATIRTALPDSAVTVHGMQQHPPGVSQHAHDQRPRMAAHGTPHRNGGRSGALAVHQCQ